MLFLNMAFFKLLPYQLFIISLLFFQYIAANNTNISAKEVLYIPENKLVKLVGDVSVSFDSWTFIATQGEYLIEEKKLLLGGDLEKEASFNNLKQNVFGRAKYIEVTIDQSIELEGDAELTSNSEIIKSNKISYRFPN